MKAVTSTIILLCICANVTIYSYKQLAENPHAIITNHYYLQHMAHAIYFLSMLNKQNYHYQPCNVITHNNHIQIDSIYFSHHIIQKCIKKMIASASLGPLLSLCAHANDYRYIHDEQLLHELLSLIFVVYKQILLNECDCNNHSLKAITLNDILIISNKINQLPVAEVLNAIEMLVIELPPFLEKYEFTSAISWKEWLKKYWWVPPVFGIWFGLKVLFYLQKTQESPYGIFNQPITLQLLVTTHQTESEVND